MKALKKAVYSKANGDTTLLATLVGGVHYLLAPAGTACPYGVFQFLGSSAVWLLKVQESEEFTLQWRIVDEGMSGVNIETAKASLLDLFNDQPLTVTGKTCWLCRLQGEIPDYAERDDNGKVLQHGGLIFSIVLA